MHFLLSLDLLENDFGSTTYNADFDDDDINVHFSQDELEPAVLSMSRINMSGLLMKIHFKL